MIDKKEQHLTFPRLHLFGFFFGGGWGGGSLSKLTGI